MDFKTQQTLELKIDFRLDQINDSIKHIKDCFLDIENLILDFDMDKGCVFKFRSCLMLTEDLLTTINEVRHEKDRYYFAN